ncbi:MAG: DUF1800 domain-containing protein [Bacteroidetes bacterium]|nr:DUF1800 domain-containing protein [Bacteroidota bacterium]
MDRREFLTARKKTQTRQQKTTTRPFRTESGLMSYSGAWTINEVTHLLKRMMFGATKADVQHFLSMSMSQAVDELLNPVAPLPTPPVNDYSASVTDPAIAAGQTWINNPAPETSKDLNEARCASFKSWWIGSLINQDRSVREKLTLFWANHFGTQASVIKLSHLVYKHNDLLRKNCLGNFKQMVKEVTIDGGMLRFLNGYLNEKNAPDENYGRELQELFTIGKDPVTNIGPYTEGDVQTAAKVLTGWSINDTTLAVSFDPAKHDTSDKQFSSFYGNTVVTGQAGANGALETDALIAMLFQKSHVSEFICRKLYRWFVYYDIDAGDEANVIQPLAQIFRENNYDIKPVLSALFKSEHFFDVLNQSCIIKPPVDHVIGCMREFGVSFPDKVAAYQDAYNMWETLLWSMGEVNQLIGEPPSVSGWEAYYQAPQFHEIWINSDTLPKRNQFTDTMISFGFTQGQSTLKIDTLAFTQTLPNPSDPNALVNDAVALLYRMPISDTTKQMIKQQILLSNQTSDYYWTNAWNAYLAEPTNQMVANVVSTRLKSFYQYLMNMAEYQLS